MMQFLSGKKSYLCAILVVVLGLCGGLGWFTVPDPVMVVLVALFGASLRAGVKKTEAAVKEIKDALNRAGKGK